MKLDWSDIPQLEWNSHSSVADALTAVRSAADREGSKRAYDQLLHALGNNHAGTYYPIAVAVIPALKIILESKATWPKVAVLEALTDLTGSFIPEPRYDCLPGTNHGTREALYEAVASLRGIIKSLINSEASDAAQVGRSANRLLMQLSEITQDREAP